MGTSEQLIIAAPDVAALAVEELHLRAVGVRPRLYYRMDATVAPGGTLAWRVSDVIGPSGLTGTDIGVYSWAEAGATGSSFPCTSVSPNVPDALAAGSVVLRIRTYTTLDRVLWRRFRPAARPPNGAA